MEHIVLVLIAVALGLYLWMKYIPDGPPGAPPRRPWLTTFKMIVAAVVTVVTLLWALATAGYALTDGPVFGPRHYNDGSVLHSPLSNDHDHDRR